MAGDSTLVLRLCVLVAVAGGALAGQAFPVDSEMYAIDLFKQINPELEWDPSNFLVDLSGFYARCSLIHHRGPIEVKRKTPQEKTIGGLVDHIEGTKIYAHAVKTYIKDALDSWVKKSPFIDQIKLAKNFGCSVEPGCNDQVSIGCLFSPRPYDIKPEQPVMWMLGMGQLLLMVNIHQGIEGEQKSLAFTKEQYSSSETITETVWDRSHLLENLSGFDTDCKMIGRSPGDWPWETSVKEAKKRGFHVTGLFGDSENLGSTPNAIKEIQKHWVTIPAEEVGCSVIPDCKLDGRLIVVVGCIFHD